MFTRTRWNNLYMWNLDHVMNCQPNLHQGDNSSYSKILGDISSYGKMLRLQFFIWEKMGWQLFIRENIEWLFFRWSPIYFGDIIMGTIILNQSYVAVWRRLSVYISIYQYSEEGKWRGKYIIGTWRRNFEKLENYNIIFLLGWQSNS